MSNAPNKLPSPERQAQEGPFLADACRSYRHFYGEDLCPERLLLPSKDLELFSHLFHLNGVLLSHRLSQDPIFNFANQTALKLWELEFDAFTQLPSRKSAEADRREERQKLLDDVKRKGFTNDYHGIRTSSTGQSFHIEGVKVWNVNDDSGRLIGQAARFLDWRMIPST